MDKLEAKILLRNLLKRMSRISSGSFDVPGGLTEDEHEALRLAFEAVGGERDVSVSSDLDRSEPSPPLTSRQTSKSGITRKVPRYEPALPDVETLVEQSIQEPRPKFEIDDRTIRLRPPPNDRRLCIDFGTAMSKVTLVRDPTEERDYEDIAVLGLGEPGDQEEISKTMLVSSVYIDNAGLLWFGHLAVEHCNAEFEEGGRQRIDNIKRSLSEEGLRDKVQEQFNPTDHDVTYADMVLAYLMFLTWCVNHCLNDISEPLNLSRRFAMPCLDEIKSTDVQAELSKMLGMAQVLADSFFSVLRNGIPIADFLAAKEALPERKLPYDFVGEGITEPLGVASSLLPFRPQREGMASLLMVVDVGAGTSDFSMYLVGVPNKDTGLRTAVEVANSSHGLTEAGNHLDKLLQSYIFSKAGVTSDHPQFRNIQGSLALQLREWKERLFEEEDITVPLFHGELVDVSLVEFLSLEQVEAFASELKRCRQEILERIDRSFVHGAPAERLAVVLTGGGAELPMVRDLAQGKVTAQGKELKVVQTLKFPAWLAENYVEFEDDYPRIAVSLGGARKSLVQRGGIASITAGDVKVAPTLHVDRGPLRP